MIVPIMTAMGYDLGNDNYRVDGDGFVTPPMTKQSNPQIMADPAIRETRFVPLLNMGKSCLESQKQCDEKDCPAGAQCKPHAELKPICSPKPFLIAVQAA